MTEDALTGGTAGTARHHGEASTPIWSPTRHGLGACDALQPGAETVFFNLKAHHYKGRAH